MSENLISIKCVLLGETAVGKSSFINRFISDTFLNNYVSTSAGCCSTKKVVYEKANKTINYEIWDTAGQEKYKSLTKFFYKDAAMIILVYDITRKESYDNLKNYWYKEIQEHGEKDIVLGIAGNKSDLYDNEQVTEDEARDFAREIGAVFKLTSANTNTGIDDLFRAVGCKVLDPDFNPNSNKTPNNNIQIDDGKKKKKRTFC